MKAKPLLIVQFKRLLNRSMYETVNEDIGKAIDPYGWACLVLDGCDEQAVKVFAPDGQPIEEAAGVIDDLKTLMNKLHEK